MKFVYLKQRSAEWLNWRKTKIGASDAPVIMGESPYKKAESLLKQKLGASEMAASWAMQKGQEMEPIIRQEYEKLTGRKVYPACVESSEFDFMAASLDGITLKGDLAVELKLANLADHTLAKTGEVPQKYYGQLQHQMEVLGLDEIHYASYHKNELEIVPVFRDERYINELLEKEEEFYGRMTCYLCAAS